MLIPEKEILKEFSTQLQQQQQSSVQGKQCSVAPVKNIMWLIGSRNEFAVYQEKT